jgi:hypothetical protein
MTWMTEKAARVRGIRYHVGDSKSKGKRALRLLCDFLRELSLRTVLRQALDGQIPAALHRRHLFPRRDEVHEDRHGLPVETLGVGAVRVVKSEQTRVLVHKDDRIAEIAMSVFKEEAKALFQPFLSA